MEEGTQLEQENKSKKKSKIPLTVIRRILHENGVNKISTDGLDEVSMMIQDIIRELANNSVIYTKHAKRIITNKSDILLAMR